MRFNVLGRLRVEPQTPSAAKMCTVLGTLLVGANEVVSSDGLIDELWGDDPPRTATTTLHVYISHLRKMLADGDPAGRRDIIETSLSGYLIRASARELDLHRFEDLCAEGHNAYARRDFGAAGPALQDALALWTGPLLAGVPRGRRLQAAADRLELLRLDAGEERIAAELWLGRHRQLVGELTVLAREHPLRETLHAHLIVALYRSHRQSEALAAYDTIRRALADELGTDPGAGLRELHRRLLRSEPVRHFEQCLGGRETAELAGAAPAPVVRLPRAVHRLTGRQEELARAESLLRGSPDSPAVRALDIVGTAGVGKSAFALELAHRTAELFPDGRVFVSMRGAEGRPLDARGAMLRTLRLLRPTTDTPQPAADTDADELGDLLHVALSGRRMLLVLDDAGSDAQVRPIVSAASSATVLITCRTPAGRHGGRPFPLEALGPADSVALLAATAGRELGDDPAAGEDIARLCGRLPLTLKAAGAVLAVRPHWPARKLADRLADERSRLDVLRLGDPEVRTRLLAGLLDLDADARRAFALLTLAPGQDFASWSAAALLGTEHGAAERVVEQLVQARLLRPRAVAGAPVRYGYDEPFRALAGELLAEESPEQVRAATRRLCAGYLALARQAQARMTPGRCPGADGGEDGTPRAECDPDWLGTEHPVGDTPLRWFRQEGAALADTVRRAHAERWWRMTWALAEAAMGYFEVSGGWESWESTAELALDAARRSASGAAEARVLCGQGDLAWQRRQFELSAARYRLARRRAREAADHRTEARALIGLADTEWSRGRLDQARRFYGKASLLSRTGGDLHTLSDALRGIALTALREGEPRAALRSFGECAAASRRAGDRRWSEYARRAQEEIHRALAAGDPFGEGPLEVRPGVWAMHRPPVAHP